MYNVTLRRVRATIGVRGRRRRN